MERPPTEPGARPTPGRTRLVRPSPQRPAEGSAGEHASGVDAPALAKRERVPAADTAERTRLAAPADSQSAAQREPLRNRRPELGAAGRPKHEPPQPTPLAAPERNYADSENVCIAGSGPLLVIVGRLRNAARPGHRYGVDEAELDALQAQLESAITNYREQVSAAYGPGTMEHASYAMCTLLDESMHIARTAAADGLVESVPKALDRFHRSDHRGESGFFERLAQLEQQASTPKVLLEFYYVCLTLGLRGHYQFEHDGERQLRETEDRLFARLGEHRSRPYDALSPHWQPAEVRNSKLVRRLPMWVVAAVTLCVAAATYYSVRKYTEALVDPLYARLLDTPADTTALDPEALMPVLPPVLIAKAADDPLEAAAPRPQAPLLDLRSVLAADVKRGTVELSSDDRRTTVVLRGAGGVSLFRSGSARVNSRYRPLVGRVAQALQQVEGAIEISGHTDSVPIKSVKYPSNEALSRDRASAVEALFAAEPAPASRTYSTRGLGAKERIENPDNTAAKRARNRRVEIKLNGVLREHGAEQPS